MHNYIQFLQFYHNILCMILTPDASAKYWHHTTEELGHLLFKIEWIYSVTNILSIHYCTSINSNINL
jgi:hypothetical protein